MKNNLPSPGENPRNYSEKWEGVVSFLRSIFDFQEGVSKAAAVEEIKSNISFRGHYSWVLIFSIMIASIGLNVNSTAVVIGAMLISPLMGPIVGIGYALGVNDYETLKRSFMNVAIMVIISLATSFLYFYLNPLSEITTNELLARTKPTLLDVFIATFGGFAGAIALTREEKSNAIPGVAIATALMPPLCTAGYGLATSNWSYFGGAFYLFFINSVFISLTTFIVIKTLKFPLARYSDAKKRRKTHWVVALIAVVTLLPSAYFFFNAMREEIFKARVVSFIQKEMEEKFPESNFTYNSRDIVYNDSINTITIWNTGKRISPDLISFWTDNLTDITQSPTRVIIQQGDDVTLEIAQAKEGLLGEILNDNKRSIEKRDSIIQALQAQLHNETSLAGNSFATVSQKAKALFPTLTYFGYANFEVTNFKKSSKIPTTIVGWNTPHSNEQKRLKKWLEVELQVDTLNIIEKK